MAEICDVDTVTADRLDELHGGRVAALRIRRFVVPAVAEVLAGRLARHESLSRYRNTPELMRVGQSHYEVHYDDGTTDPEALANYLSRADQLMNEIRRACQPHQSPMDRLWQMLDHSVGLTRAVVSGRPMFAGVVRVFPQGSELLPHNDVFARDAPGLALASQITAQFAANVYLGVPDEGGELELWSERPDEARLAKIHSLGSKYGADRALLPDPDLRISVDHGDLVIIDATRLHAVSRQVRGMRVGMSCFLGRLPEGGLVCWS